jgi:SAM-dependent methyltransferase
MQLRAGQLFQVPMESRLLWTDPMALGDTTVTVGSRPSLPAIVWPLFRSPIGGSRVSFYQHHVLPRLLHLVMQQEAMMPFRRRVIGAAEGRVLEIGIGSGLNLPLYELTVGNVIGLDPSPELLLMARDRAAAASVHVKLLEASAEVVPLDDASIDTVVTTWTLCTIPDAPRALTELRRVLRPGGALLFVEHGRAPEPGVARWQDRLDPLWRRVAGGCHLNRKIDDLISGSGFRVDALTNARLPGPRTHTFLYEGRARPA